MWRRFVAHLLPTGIFSICSVIRSRRNRPFIARHFAFDTKYRSGNAWLTIKWFYNLNDGQRIALEWLSTPNWMIDLPRRITKLARDFSFFLKIHAASVFHALFIFHWKWNNNEMWDRLIYSWCVCPHASNISFSIPTFRILFSRQWIMFTKIDACSCGSRCRRRNRSRLRICLCVVSDHANWHGCHRHTVVDDIVAEIQLNFDYVGVERRECLSIVLLLSILNIRHRFAE